MSEPTNSSNPPTPHDSHDAGRGPAGPDATFDANLRDLGRRIGRLPAPSAAQVLAWRGGATARANAEHAPEPIPFPRRAPGRSRWLAMASAAAACIAIGALVALQPWGSAVQASTIINQLRSKTFGGVNIFFDHVSSAGTTVDGEVRVRLDAPVSIEALDDAGSLEGAGHFGAAYGKFTITTDGTVPGWGGARIEAEGALTHGSGWMYLVAPRETVRQIAAAEPRAAGIASLAGTGVLLNIGGVDEAFFEGLSALLCQGCPISSEASGAANWSGGLHARIGTDAAGHGTVSIGMSSKIPAGAPPSGRQMQRFASLARGLLSGKARQGELDQLRAMIQNDFAQRATVRKVDDGTYILAAELPEPAPAGATDSTAAPSGSGGTLRVCYEEAAGVRWAELTNMRDTTGRLRIVFDATPIDKPLLEYERLVDTGRTNYLDLRHVMRLFMPAVKQAPDLLLNAVAEHMGS